MKVIRITREMRRGCSHFCYVGRSCIVTSPGPNAQRRPDYILGRTKIEQRDNRR